jgi:glycosyltransferase involved in cell wall biosynthesis
MNIPLLSIVIPTRNRFTTLINVVDMILGFNSNDDIEIVIQDNSDNNTEILDFLKERKEFSNLKYFYESERISVIQNSDKAILNATGEYICFIGDDDGVMPYIIDIVRWMKLNHVKALKSYKPIYLWPGQNSRMELTDKSGILRFDKFHYRFKSVSINFALNYTLKVGATSMEMLPGLYHGIVKKQTLDEIYHTCKSFFPGPSPDMANAVALTKFISSFIHCEFPVIITGNSPKSTGGLGLLKKHIAKIEEVSHLPKDTAENWSQKIPKYWTGPTIWAESFLKALENCGDFKTGKKLRYSYLYASLVVLNSNHSKTIFQGFEGKVLSTGFIFDCVSVFIKRIKSFVLNKLSSKYYGVKDMKEAIGILDTIVDKQKLKKILDN